MVRTPGLCWLGPDGGRVSSCDLLAGYRGVSGWPPPRRVSEQPPPVPSCDLLAGYRGVPGWPPPRRVSGQPLLSLPVTSWLGTQVCPVGLLPAVSQGSPSCPFRPVRCCLYSCHNNVEHAALLMAVLGFCCPAEVLQKHTGLWAGRQGAALVSAELDGLLGGDHSGSLTCCSLAFCLIHVPCDQLPR